MLTRRRASVLRLIIDEYIMTATPVPSEALAHKYALGVSPATVRNDMATLEDGGYISRRHISGGGIPTDQGYRYYVESLMREEDVPVDERLMVSHLFFLVERELEEWNRLAAALLARTLNSVAIVSFPKAARTRLKHIELVALQELLALLVVVLRGTRLRRQLVAFDEAVTQDELNAISNRLNALCEGMTRPQIVACADRLSSQEGGIARAVVQVMEKEDALRYGELCVEGVRHILGQPEFSGGEKTMALLDLLEGGRLVTSILPETVAPDGVQVIIGSENREDAMRECSVVLAGYGVPDEVGGALAVLGPTRMPYDRAVSRVRFIGSLMSDLIWQIYRERRPG